MAELAVIAHEVEMIGSVLVFNHGVAVETVGYIRHVLIVHQPDVARGGKKCLTSVVAGKTAVGDHISGFDLATTLDDLKVAALAGHTRFLNRLMSNRFTGAGGIVSV